MRTAMVAGAAGEESRAMVAALRRDGYAVHEVEKVAQVPRELERVRPQVFVPIGMEHTHAACRERSRFEPYTRLLVPPLSGFEAAWQAAERAMCCGRLGIPAAWPGEMGDEGEEGSQTALLLFGADSRLRAAFTARGTRQVSSWEPNLVEQVLPFFTVWAWRGPVEVKFRFDRRERREKVTAMLPFWAGSVRVVADAYPGMLAMVARLVRGEEVAAETYPAYAAGRQEPLR